MSLRTNRVKQLLNKIQILTMKVYSELHQQHKCFIGRKKPASTLKYFIGCINLLPVTKYSIHDFFLIFPIMSLSDIYIIYK